jgi:prevent-host-death family protein
MKQRIVKAAEFKATCLALMEEVATTGRELVVTKRGKPLVRVIPVEDAAPMAGSVRFLVDEEDLLAPIDVAWNANQP